MKRFWVFTGVFLAALLTGCGKENEKMLTVCTEAELEESARFLASGYQKQYPDVTVKVEALPTEAEEREAAVKKIQTQTMAGEGPDIFLLPTRYGNMDIEEKEPLFENINKVADAKVFLDLSPYMEKDKNFRAEDYQEVIFQAGRHEEKQYLLPLSYRLPVMYIEKNRASANGLSSLAPSCKVEELKKKIESTENPGFQYVGCSLIRKTSENYLASLIDYENQTVGLEKKELLQIIEEEAAFMKNCPTYTKAVKEHTAVVEEGISEVEFHVQNTTFPVDYQEGVFLTPEDKNGQILAEIPYYAAVNRGCSLPEEAYRYVMLFLDKNFQAGSEMDFGEGKQGLFSILQKDIPVCKEAWNDWLVYLSGYQVTDAGPGFDSLKAVMDSPDGAVFPCSVQTYTNQLLQPIYQGGDADCEAFAEELYKYYSQTAQE